MSTSLNGAREKAYPTIVKRKRELRLCPNLVDYDCTCHHFTWESAPRMFEGLPQGRGLNIAYEAVDRHAAGPLANHLALRWIGRSGTIWDFTYATLRQETNQFANVLRDLGVSRGDAVFALMGRIPELYVTALGTLKTLGMFCPLFSAFGPEPIRARLGIAEGKVLVTTERLYRRWLFGKQQLAPVHDGSERRCASILPPPASPSDKVAWNWNSR
jgi:acetyl-CoA synthetase